MPRPRPAISAARLTATAATTNCQTGAGVRFMPFPASVSSSASIYRNRDAPATRPLPPAASRPEPRRRLTLGVRRSRWRRHPRSARRDGRTAGSAATCRTAAGHRPDRANRTPSPAACPATTHRPPGGPSLSAGVDSRTVTAHRLISSRSTHRSQRPCRHDLLFDGRCRVTAPGRRLLLPARGPVLLHPLRRGLPRLLRHLAPPPRTRRRLRRRRARPASAAIAASIREMLSSNSARCACRSATASVIVSSYPQIRRNSGECRQHSPIRISGGDVVTGVTRSGT